MLTITSRVLRVGKGLGAMAKQKINVGDRVAYSVTFLRSIGEYTGPMPFGRARVVALEPLGSVTVARLKWENGDLPERVNVANLVARSAG